MARSVLIRLLPLVLTGLLAGASSGASALAAAGFQLVAVPALPGSNFNQLDNVASVGSHEAWSVGFSRVGSGPFRALVEHWNGSSWSSVASATRPDADDTRLHGVAAVTAKDVWAVGAESGATNHSLIEHWNGSSWSLVPSPANEPQGAELVAVSAASSRDAWAVGDFNSGDGSETLVEHWDGTSWRVVTAATIFMTGHDFLSGVAAVSATDAWAVGRSGRHPGPIVEHWDGTSWRQVAQPVSGFDSSLNAVSAVSSRDIWAVGTQGLSQTVTEHWDGTSWTLVPSPFPTDQNAQNVLTGVAALGHSDVWAVGRSLVNFSQGRTLAEHWDGTAWSLVPTPDPSDQDALSGVAGSGAGQTLWAVGSRDDPRPLILATSG